MQRRYIPWVVLLLFLLVLTGCKPAAKEEGPKPVAVEVVKVARGSVQTFTLLSGRVEAQLEVPVPAKLPAQVTAVHAEVGQAVKAGQVLVELDKKDVLEQVRQAEAGLRVAEAGLPPASGESSAAASARAALESAQADLKRVEHLKEQGAASEQMLEQARVRAAGAAAQYQGVLDQEKMARARYEQAQAALELARSQLANASITAPVSGLVASLPVTVGQTVNPGIPVATIVNMDKVKIKLNVTEKDVGHLLPGQEVKVRITSLSDKEVTGKLTALAPAADPRTHTFPAEVTLDNDGHTIKPGMFAEVELRTAALTGVLAVPREAVVTQGSKQIAYVVKDGKAYLREVGVGLVNDHLLQVTAGLKEGELLVVKGQQYLSDASPVTVVSGGEEQ